MDNKLTLVFSMEKCGATTCMQAFQVTGFNPDRGTRHNLDYLGSVERYACVIVPIRSPISRNISFFFEVHGNDLLQINLEMQDIYDAFMDRIDHDEPLKWFDEVFRPFTGIDIYKQKFNRTQGWSIVQKKYLVIQTRKLGDALPEAFEQAFGARPPELHRSSSMRTRAYGDLYDRFLTWVRFPADYVDHMLSSKYAKFFYTKKVLDEIRERWINGV